MSVSAVFAPFVVKLALRLVAPGGPMGSDLASFNLAHASSADPNVDAAVESAARAVLYALAEDRSSEYASWDLARSFLVSTAWGGLGAGGSGRFSEDMGFAVDAIEYIGDPGTGGSCEGVGETGREALGEAIMAR